MVVCQNIQVSDKKTTLYQLCLLLTTITPFLNSGSVVLSDPESVAKFGDKFIVKPKFVVDYLQHLEVIELKKNWRLEERTRERKGQEKVGRRK